MCNAVGDPPPCNATHTEKECSSLGCEFDNAANYCKEPGTKTPCDRLYMQETCKKEKARCTWWSGPGVCHDRGEVLPCSKFYSDESCEDGSNSVRCEWVPEAYTCLEIGTVLPCDRFYGAEGCGAREDCAWDPLSQTCNDPGTVRLYAAWIWAFLLRI